MFENDTYSHRGWVNSDYFLKRAFGVMLYNMCGVLIIYGIILVTIIILIVMIAIIFGIIGAV